MKKKPSDIYILCGCEESQAVCIQFRELGFNAFSCDLQESSGGHPEWHLQMDIFEAIKLRKWDMMIAFPTCTYLTVSANKWMIDQPPLKSGALVGEARRQARKDAVYFFMALVNADIPRIAIENPVGIMSTEYRQPDQIIQPYYFGDESRKRTCLWLKNLPPLFHASKPDLFNQVITHVDEGESHEWITKDGKLKRQPMWYSLAKHGKDLGTRSKERSKTFPGISKAMAEQWGQYILQNK